MQAIILGLVPLLVFAILESFTTLNIALVATIIATLIEIIYSLYVFKTLDAISIFSIILVIILVYFSYKKQNRVLIKLKPGILKASIGLYLIIAFLFGHPILYELVIKYPQLIPENQLTLYQTPYGEYLLTQLSIEMGKSFLIYGIIVGWAGIKLNNFWWTFINIFGLFLSIIIPVFIVISA